MNFAGWQVPRHYHFTRQTGLTMQRVDPLGSQRALMPFTPFVSPRHAE